jgi:hypothetical protein
MGAWPVPAPRIMPIGVGDLRAPTTTRDAVDGAKSEMFESRS